MAIQGGIPVSHEVAFPHGCYVVGEVSQVLDFEASTKDRPVPARDKVTGELMWAVPVMDGDPSLKAAAKSLNVKIVGPVEPVVPAAPPEMAGLPFVPVEFEGLAVTPYVNPQNRLAYSFKARGMRAVSAPGAKAARHGRGAAGDAG
ncbi:plasmid replication, integration and excision activator [Microtetraspora sp. AC03309]|nr:plasmid replication, integration and excision activator [Microtetraspora sp. AC03309]